ncbi:Kelch repeat-containing protein [Streptomyces sp. NPDC057433]|uniref:Kelch repeat-containing protein n=1 Tax=Streptomyces sp. NPDC057433 TaxID=3346132 RepID=UPI0036BC0177
MKRRTALLLGAALAVAPAARAHAHPGHPTSPGGAPTTPQGPYRGGWRRCAPIAGGPRQEHSVAAVGDDVYVIGGILPGGGPSGGVTTTGRVEVHDTRRDTWSDAAPLPVAMNHPNVAAVGGRIYVLGGLSGGAEWQALRDCFVYSPRADRWRRLPPLPADVARGSAAIGVHGTTVLLAGGMRVLVPGAGGLQDTVDTVSAYDVVTRRWETLPSLPQARDHVGGAVVGGTFYVLGGRDRGQVNVRDTVYALHLRTRRWTERAPMPTARGGIAAAAVGTRIHTFGGEGRHDGTDPNTVFDETEAYDTVRDRWQRLAPMPVPRHGTAAVTVRGTVHIPGGGVRGGAVPVDVNDAYRPAHR